MTRILTIVFTLTSYWVLAQKFPHEIWHEGKIVLTSEDTIYGDVKYDLQNDLIQININKTIQTYSARKILFFEIFDATGNYFRQFYSLPYQIKPNYKVPLLFELLYEGPMTLLTREHVVMETTPHYNYYYRTSGVNRQKLAYTFYFLPEGKKIYRYEAKKKELTDVIMKDKSSEIKKFIKKNKLKHDRKVDLIKITTYYNSLKEA